MDFASLLFALCAIAICFILDFAKINAASEEEIEIESKMSKFGKFGLQKSGKTGVKLDDIGGYEDVKAELKEAIAAPLQNKAVSSAYELKPASGVLLFGPPGTGKTLIMKALATELKLEFIDISCTDILSSWHGESEKNVKDAFMIARAKAPCILFFDEIDALAKSRDKFFNDDVGPRVLSVLLQEMDGFNKKAAKPVIIVGATNVPNQLDAAIMRPGRLDKIIYMHLPDAPAREQILKVHSSKVPLGDDIDFHALTNMTKGYSGADLANVVREASTLAAREARAKDKLIPVSQKHFLSVLGRLKPSTTDAQLQMYEQFGFEFERSMRGA
jgi:SpoVK/Ycf46/Vps4 family AAA+-type ATPase